MILFALKPYALGLILVAQTKKGICAVLLGTDQLTLIKTLKEIFPDAIPAQANEMLHNTLMHLYHYLEQMKPLPKLPLDVLKGTPFERQVWNMLQTIPLGKTSSYGAIAQQLRLTKKHCRAVASACRKNIIALIYPCHRVIYHDGRSSGYRWGGTTFKNYLLEREKNDAHTLHLSI